MYHINKSGQVGKCQASISCPFGEPSEHYSTAREARQAFEASNSSLSTPIGVDSLEKITADAYMDYEAVLVNDVAAFAKGQKLPCISIEEESGATVLVYEDRDGLKSTLTHGFKKSQRQTLFQQGELNGMVEDLKITLRIWNY